MSGNVMLQTSIVALINQYDTVLVFSSNHVTILHHFEAVVKRILE